MAAADESTDVSLDTSNEHDTSADGFFTGGGDLGEEKPFSMTKQLKKFAASKGKELEADKMLGRKPPMMKPLSEVRQSTVGKYKYSSGCSNANSIPKSCGSSSSTYTTSNSNSRFKIGDQVNVQNRNSALYDPATIQGVNSDGSYSIKTDDTGELKPKVEEGSLVRRQPLAVGEGIRSRLREQGQARLRI
jgi:hypothetical protein